MWNEKPPKWTVHVDKEVEASGRIPKPTPPAPPPARENHPELDCLRSIAESLAAIATVAQVFLVLTIIGLLLAWLHK